jgi:hypothetical protein
MEVLVRGTNDSADVIQCKFVVNPSSLMANVICLYIPGPTTVS